MLVGQYHTKLTSKGRVAVPAKFRQQLGQQIIVCRWYEKSLSVFSPESWRKIVDLAVGESLLTAPTRETERFLLGGAYELELDSQGRFVIPKPLRDYAQIDNDLVFVGLRDRVEMWDLSMWKKKEEEIVNKAEELINEVQTAKLTSIKGIRN